MVLVVGPIEPATKRGRSAVATLSAASRAIAAAARLSSRAWACRPYSASTTEVEPKLLVSMISAPACRKLRCRLRIRSGRVTDQIFVASLQFRTAEILGVKMHVLDRGAHRPVHDHHARGQNSRSNPKRSVRVKHQICISFFCDIRVKVYRSAASAAICVCPCERQRSDRHKMLQRFRTLSAARALARHRYKYDRSLHPRPLAKTDCCRAGFVGWENCWPRNLRRARADSEPRFAWR